VRVPRELLDNLVKTFIAVPSSNCTDNSNFTPAKMGIFFFIRKRLPVFLG